MLNAVIFWLIYSCMGSFIPCRETSSNPPPQLDPTFHDTTAPLWLYRDLTFHIVHH
jgi:hypothetical protein